MAKPSEMQPVLAQEPTVRVVVQPSGWFRLEDAATGAVGEAAHYQGIATLEANGDLFVAVSPYFEGCLPPELILRPLRVMPAGPQYEP